ncbi:uncharacterized protein [Nicotiana sylvestris]
MSTLCTFLLPSLMPVGTSSKAFDCDLVIIQAGVGGYGAALCAIKKQGFWIMALRRMLGYSDGELMRSDAKPCSRLMRQTAGIFSVGGALGFWVLCRLHYGPRITVPRSLRWATCGTISMSSSTALLVRLFSPECEPQNIAAYDKKG